jgi:anthranilate synthase component 2
LFDNYDSFTYNLVHLLEAADSTVQVDVMKNDSDIGDRWQEYDRIVLSPGPGLPEESGELMTFLQKVVGHRPVLGVCLGLQAVQMHFGGSLVNLNNVLHGISLPTIILDTEEPIFKGVASPFMAGRYHSWVANPSDLPEVLKVIATDLEGQVMAIRHCTMDVVAVQFHPESVLTPEGSRILSNWLDS